MDYFFDSEHQALRDDVRWFVEHEVGPQVQEMEERRAVERELAREIAARGWIGVTIPRRYGGLALGHLAKTIVIEELSRVSGAMGAMAQASQLGVAKVVHFGSEHQKARWLPAFAAGESLPTIAVTEPESGGHVLGMSSTAVRDGDSYVLNGRKCFVGNSHIGDVHGVVARTGPGSRGLTAFLVERDRPGFRFGTPGSQAGLHGFGFGELIFKDCRVPAANRIGDEGQGLDVAYSSSTLTSARAALEIFAGRGTQRDHHIERYLRDVIHTFPAAGTSDVQRLRLAEVALGHYRGDWSGRLDELELDEPLPHAA